ncbi:FAD-binding domain-containing protein [Streptomyces sp. NPDC002666]
MGLDPRGACVRRWVPELVDVADKYIHDPWRLPKERRARLDHPDSLIDLADGLARFKQARGLA